jgi:hypothetical protein
MQNALAHAPRTRRLFQQHGGRKQRQTKHAPIHGYLPYTRYSTFYMVFLFLFSNTIARPPTPLTNLSSVLQEKSRLEIGDFQAEKD